MTAITHRLAETGDCCAYCGEPIPPNENQDALWQTGDPIAVLSGKSFSPVSYRVGKNDQNEKCSPCVSTGEASTTSTRRHGIPTSAPDAG